LRAIATAKLKESALIVPNLNPSSCWRIEYAVLESMLV